MKKSSSSFLLLICTTLILQSCEFNCSVGKKEDPKGTAVVKEDGARIYNSIDLQASGVKVDKAYLLFNDNARVPDDNFVDFKKPIELVLLIDSGWTAKEGKVMLGASETITAENGQVILQEDDLFNKYPDGLTAADAKIIYLSATLHLKENAAPATFTVSFRVWDKNGNAFVQGSYKLYSK